MADMDMIGKIMKYEDGEMDEDERNEFFQELIDTGLINNLQGSYGREAARLAELGLISVGEGDGRLNPEVL